MLKEIFQEAYDRNRWKSQVLPYLSAGISKRLRDTLLDVDETDNLNDTERHTFQQLLQIGTFVTSDGELMPIYEVTLSDRVQIDRNRVQVNEIIKKLIVKDSIKAALCVFHTPNKQEWRFSFISKTLGSEFFEELEGEETNPKRYTYIFGTPEEHRTASDRFKVLRTSNFTFDDFFEAFAIEALSKEFFYKYRDEHYQPLVDYLNDLPSKATFFRTDKEIRDFVKKMLGRIVFLYFVQKKGWLGASSTEYNDGDHNFLEHYFIKAGADQGFYPNFLAKLFFDTLNRQRENDDFKMPNGEIVKIPYLNGGLFEIEKEAYSLLSFPPHYFQYLFDFLNSYNFTIYENSPDDHVVAVDPEMLGNIFENLLEDNKDKGAFYTPKEIVQYMCQQSLIEYLNTKLNVFDVPMGAELSGLETQLSTDKRKYRKEAKGQLSFMEADKRDNVAKENIEDFVINKNANDFIKQHADQIDLFLNEVKICDPAIGSGAFPMGLLREIFDLKVILHDFVRRNKNELFHNEHIYDNYHSAIKASIIQNSIYGVDIEKGAVDIARLRFWLSLIVDEKKPKPLPNLDYKIVVGNSLVPMFEGEPLQIDWNKKYSYGTGRDFIKNIRRGLTEITDLQRQFFDANSNDKKTLSDKIRQIKINILLNQLKFNREKYRENNPQKGGLMPTTKEMKQNTIIQLDVATFNNNIKKLEKLLDNDQPLQYFSWELDFPNVLNPLLNSQNGFDIVIGNPPYIKEYTNRNAFDGFRKSPYYQGKMDIWYGFACIGLDLLKENGVECFIAQNNWITSAGASKLREKVLNEVEIKTFTDFEDYKVFTSAGIQTMIYVIKNSKPSKNYKVKYSKLKNSNITKEQLSIFLEFNENNNQNAERFYFDMQPGKFYGSTISFNSSVEELVLDEILNNSNTFLSEKEVAQGIVTPQDFLNKKNQKKLGLNYTVGEGIFVLKKFEVENLKLNANEHRIIKPLYSTNEVNRYWTNNQNENWIIYSTKEVIKRIHKYPNIKNHLDRFESVITSSNKPYGLHRPRNENYFFGKKIICTRKCNIPTFSYSFFDTYVLQTFNVIKTNRMNLKYLTGILNSHCIKFWLKNKGKMQGINFQLDKAPLLEIPLIKTEKEKIISPLVDYILYLHEAGEQVDKYVPNTHIIEEIEKVINGCVYELYFEESVRAAKADILDLVGATFLPFPEGAADTDKAAIIEKAYEQYQSSHNEIRNRLILQNTRVEEVKLINKKV